jgi:hypothetical protein
MLYVFTVIVTDNNPTVSHKLFIQSHHQHGQLIADQIPGEQNPLYQLVITHTSQHNTNDQHIPYHLLKSVPSHP